MGYAADTFAQITRESYQDWKDRFYPKQKELMELATNGKLLQEQLGRVDENNANALRSAQQATAKPQCPAWGEQQHQRQQPGFAAALMTAGTENGLREAGAGTPDGDLDRRRCRPA